MNQTKNIFSSVKRRAFQKHILTWYKSNKRNLPWRKTTDPYKILVSEVMLQQTQVERVIPKYKAFLKQFPTLDSLAAAELGDVLRAWQGLGYNRRAKMLWELANHKESKNILYRNKMEFTEENLRTLPGIGHYTAAAMLAFSKDKPAAAIDTNVKRVFYRYARITNEETIASCVPKTRSRDWHNALMDFGSAVCTKAPQCEQCPLQRSCLAFREKDFTWAVPKQSTFKESNRFYRGMILRALHDGAKTRNALLKIGGQKKIIPALASLVKDGLIRKEGSRYTT